MVQISLPVAVEGKEEDRFGIFRRDPAGPAQENTGFIKIAECNASFGQRQQCVGAVYPRSGRLEIADAVLVASASPAGTGPLQKLGRRQLRCGDRVERAANGWPPFLPLESIEVFALHVYAGAIKEVTMKLPLEAGAVRLSAHLLSNASKVRTG
ncbi:MAG: hypothetical protein R3200_14315 [Xanthomonadales bacterium]|nr:hypothetical protein [Xanthomonadales bacterium]